MASNAKGAGAPIHPGNGGIWSMTSGASAPIATPPGPPSHLYPLDTMRSARQVLPSHCIAPTPCVASRTSLTPAPSVAARSRGTSIVVPVAYWTHPTATTDVFGVDSGDEIVRQVGRGAIFDELDSALATLLQTQPGPCDRREVRGHGDYLRSLPRRQQEGRLAQQLAGAGQDRDPRVGYRQQSGGAPTQVVEEARFVLVGHVEIAVAHDSIQQIVHGVDRWVGDQTQGGLIEIDALPQRWVCSRRSISDETITASFPLSGVGSSLRELHRSAVAALGEAADHTTSLIPA